MVCNLSIIPRNCKLQTIRIYFFTISYDLHTLDTSFWDGRLIDVDALE